MKRLVAILVLSQTAVSTVLSANESAPADSSVYKNMLLDEVVVISNPKAAARIFETPASVSVFNAERIERQNVLSIKDLSAVAPNFFIPDYGSKLTTAIYIRGIGTRTNNSVVGMYVDNIPYLDKSIFDFDFLDIERMEVLRGPQSTLYGRNTMAGLINIYTKSPFDHEGTRVMLSYGNYNTFRANLSRYGKINDKLAYSLSAQYQSSDGYFKNYGRNGEAADSTKSANGRFQLYWRPNSTTKINLATNLEYSWQAGYPYRIIDEAGQTGVVNYNDPGAYNRMMSSSSLFAEKQFEDFTMTNTTGYQYFDDNMKLDQDFTDKSIFTLNQKQKQHSASHEIVFKSDKQNNLKWLAGAFGFYQSLKTDAPVTFKKEGIDEMINGNIRIPEVSMGPMGTVAMYDSLVNDNMVIAGDFKTPTWGIAGFTQLTYDDLFVKGLSVSAGVRLDYEKSKLDYDSYATAFAKGGVVIKSPAGVAMKEITFNDTIDISIKGKHALDNLEVLPRFDIRYTPNNRCMAYATVSKGYRAGGFNFQMFSDAIRDQLQSRMVGAFIAQADKAGMGNRIPDNIRDMAKLPELDERALVTYKPEYSWNYEIGTRAEVFDKSLYVDLSAFYIDVHDQQVSTFSEQGLGRITKNSGKSRSYGAEAGIKYFPIPELAFTANYGWTHATFLENAEQKKETVNGKPELVTYDYKGNYVPFAPKHTLSVAGNYLLNFKNKWLDNMNFNVQYAGAGRIYWTEDNSQYQNFYGTLSAKISARKGICELALWGKNLTDTDYEAFYFKSLGKNLVQMGNPITFGAEFSVKF